MKLGQNMTEKPPVDGEGPPQYCSTVDLSITDTQKVAAPVLPQKVVPPDSASVKCESKNPRRRRIIKIVVIVAVVSLIAILTVFAIKFAVRNDRGDDGLQVYSLLVTNTTGNYHTSAAVYGEGRVIAIRDYRKSACYLYFPIGHRSGFYKDMFGDGDDDRVEATLIYKKEQVSGHQLVLRVIPEPVSSRVMTATAGTMISEFCGDLRGIFLENIFGSMEREEDDHERRSILILQQ